jgi:hypothetical protein
MDVIGVPGRLGGPQLAPTLTGIGGTRKRPRRQAPTTIAAKRWRGEHDRALARAIAVARSLAPANADKASDR